VSEARQHLIPEGSEAAPTGSGKTRRTRTPRSEEAKVMALVKIFNKLQPRLVRAFGKQLKAAGDPEAVKIFSDEFSRRASGPRAVDEGQSANG
jgi:hypothetical protein